MSIEDTIDYALLDKQLVVLSRIAHTRRKCRKKDRETLQGVYQLLAAIWDNRQTHCDECNTPGRTVDAIGQCRECIARGAGDA